MLVNLTPYQPEIERRKQIAAENNFEYKPQPDNLLDTGIYVCNLGFNFSQMEFEEFKDAGNIPRQQSYDLFAPDYNKQTYGVADNIEQIKEYYMEEIADPDKKYFIYVTPVFQEKGKKGKGGGWRWHKWGEYIGKLNPQYEYLDDEEFGDDFKYVLTFHIISVK